MTWNGRKFVRAHMFGEGKTRWESEAVGDYGRPLWKATQWSPSDVWFARLRLGGYRFAGQGKTAAAALTACAQEARRVAGLLADVGCGVD
jgi:hypothetical protein